MTRASGIQTPVAPLRRKVATDRAAACDAREAVLETRATFKTVLRSGWRPCRIRLTPNGITLTQGGRPVFDLTADRIAGLRIEGVRSVLGRKKEALCLDYRSGHAKHKRSRLWLTAPNLHAVRERLADLAAPIDLAALERLASHLDADAESIVWFLWQQRHATVGELAQHARIPSQMDVLLKIREVINPVAEDVLGFPLLTFVPARTDALTGRNVPNSWWLVGARRTQEQRRPEVTVDTFHEADGFRILACLPCGEARDVSVSFCGGAVEISSDGGGKPARVPLPPGLEPENCRQTFRNGILELCWGGPDRSAPAVEQGKR